MWSNLEELGLAYLASNTRKSGHEVTFAELKVQEADVGALIQHNPDVIVFTLYEVNKDDVYAISGKIKTTLPNTLICVGGAFPTYYASLPTGNPAAILKEAPAIDIVITGEAEVAFASLVDAIERGQDWRHIQGLVFREESQIVINPASQASALDALATPARDILFQNKLPFAQISASRGCTARCSFCSYKQFWPKWRGRKIEGVLDEMQQLTELYGIRAFNFIDGSFEDPGYNERRLITFAQGILERQMQIAYYVQFRAETCEKMSEEVIGLLRQSGLTNVCLGIESGNEEDLLLYHKKASLQQMHYAIRFLKTHEINVDPGFINFNAYSTTGRLRKNLLFLKQHGLAANLDYLLKSTYVYPGTQLYEQYSNDGLMTSSEINSYKFSFVHKHVEYLYKYLALILKNGGSASGNNRLYRNICHGASTNFVYASCLKSLFFRSGHIEAYQVVSEFMDNSLLLREAFSEAIANWTLELIDLAEEHWSENQAELITQKHQVERLMKETVIGFQYTHMKFMRRIKKTEMHKDFNHFMSSVF